MAGEKRTTAASLKGPKATTSALSPETVQKAEELKQRGNTFVKEEKFQHAIIAYTSAIALNPENAIFFSNRALCHLKLENPALALQDATKAIQLDPSYTKGYHRRAMALFMMRKFDEALDDLYTVCSKVPGDKESKETLKECEAQVKQQKYELMLQKKSGKIAETIRLADIQVESSYSGPHWADNAPITEEFIQSMIEEFKEQRQIHRKYAFRILIESKKLLSTLPNLVPVSIPQNTKISVCGDTHGQFFDVLNIFKLFGNPSDKNPFVFNGDYVDRGAFGTEIILTLLAYKLLFPKSMHLTRGNHEGRLLNVQYGFAQEIRTKYNDIMFELAQEVFNMLPLGIVLERQVLIVHGGLSTQDILLSDVNSLDRKRAIPDEGPMCDLLWSDPSEQPGRGPSNRGVGVLWGPDVTNKFLKDNNLKLIVRSHEMKPQGYEIAHSGSVITVFSAPNYVGQMGNLGAVIQFEGPDCKYTIHKFQAVPHPVPKVSIMPGFRL